MENDAKQPWDAHRRSEDPLKHWRSWGSWYSWGSAMGFSIFLLSVGVFILLLHFSGLL